MLMQPWDPLPSADDAGGPFGLPVLAEVPELAEALSVARQIDRLVARLVELLIELEDASTAETVTGVALEQWLAIVGRRTGTDRRMLATCAAVCRRLPAFRSALVGGAISWAQARTVALQVHRLPSQLDERLDAAVAHAVEACVGADPDALASVVGQVVDRFGAHGGQPTTPAGPQTDFLALQPRLDGTGGRFFGDAGPVGFARLDAALADPVPPDGPASSGGIGADADPRAARQLAYSGGRRRFARLMDLLDHDCTTADRRIRPSLLVRAELDTLTDRGVIPPRLLTTLTGGRVRADAATVRRLLDERGADLRSVIVDDHGRVLGVGRRRRVPPGWLSDAVLAVHDRCAEPGHCRRAARVCQLDHARPWQPARPSDLAGRTDIDQLAPLCGPANRTKERSGWRCTQSAEGIRTWRHEASGLQTRTIPDTWRPPPPHHPPDLPPRPQPPRPPPRAGPDR